MSHFLYKMNPTAKAPAGCGDIRSWFLFYKWESNDEVFVSGELSQFGEIKPGDMIWFAFNDRLIGGASVIDVQVDELRDTVEIWYDASKKLELQEHVTREHGKIPEEVGAQWLGRMRTTP